MALTYSSRVNSGEVYTGVDRRASSERRRGQERRNLVRYESIGTDRRMSSYRRDEDAFWLKKHRMPSE